MPEEIGANQEAPARFDRHLPQVPPADVHIGFKRAGSSRLSKMARAAVL
jgi:hypothetical protein